MVLSSNLMLEGALYRVSTPVTWLTTTNRSLMSSSCRMYSSEVRILENFLFKSDEVGLETYNSSFSSYSCPKLGDSSKLREELLEDSELSNPLSPSLAFLFLDKSIDSFMTTEEIVCRCQMLCLYYPLFRSLGPFLMILSEF